MIYYIYYYYMIYFGKQNQEGIMVLIKEYFITYRLLFGAIKLKNYHIAFSY